MLNRPSFLNLLPCRRACHSCPNDAWQLLSSHAIHHSDNAHNEHSHRDTKYCEEGELCTDIFLLASSTCPQVRLLAAVLVSADCRTPALAFEAVFIRARNYAEAVATTIICGISAGFFRAEAAREATWKSGVLPVA